MTKDLMIVQYLELAMRAVPKVDCRKHVKIQRVHPLPPNIEATTSSVDGRIAPWNAVFEVGLLYV